MKTKTINFSNYSSLKLGGTFEVALLERHTQGWQNYFLIGGCNNILLSNNPPPLMMLSKEFDYISINDDNTLSIGAATPSGKVVSFCKKHNIANFEFLAHLPGKMGGVVFMNAGLKGVEVFENLLRVELFSGVKQKSEIAYGYRYTNIEEPILSATFKISYGFDPKKVQDFATMRANQPSTPSAGSCFKNPPNEYAGRLIEAVGLKGLRVGGMAFSEQHANFLVNYGGGKFEDAIWLITEAKRRVMEEFGIALECEIQIV
jgi:UDP-N-acetylmuramate dehydrogenase